MAPPTRATLQDLWRSHRRHGGLAAMLAAERTAVVPPILPKMIEVSAEELEIVLPWDEQYEQTPGEGCRTFAELPGLRDGDAVADAVSALALRARARRRTPSRGAGGSAGFKESGYFSPGTRLPTALCTVSLTLARHFLGRIQHRRRLLLGRRLGGVDHRAGLRRSLRSFLLRRLHGLDDALLGRLQVAVGLAQGALGRRRQLVDGLLDGCARAGRGLASGGLDGGDAAAGRRVLRALATLRLRPCA